MTYPLALLRLAGIFFFLKKSIHGNHGCALGSWMVGIIINPGPSCHAIKSTATFAWSPCWTGILKATPFLKGTSLFWWSTMAPGLPNGLTQKGVADLELHPTFFPSFPVFCTQGQPHIVVGKLFLLTSPLHIFSHDIPPNQILTHLISSSCLLLRGPRLRQYKCLLT